VVAWAGLVLAKHGLVLELLSNLQCLDVGLRLDLETRSERVLALVGGIDLSEDVATALLGVDRVLEVGLDGFAGDSVLRVLLRRVAEQVKHVTHISPAAVCRCALALRTHVGNTPALAVGRQSERLLVGVFVHPGLALGGDHGCRRSKHAVVSVIVRVRPAVFSVCPSLDLGSHLGTRVFKRDLHLRHCVNVHDRVSGSGTCLVLHQVDAKLFVRRGVAKLGGRHDTPLEVGGLGGASNHFVGENGLALLGSERSDLLDGFYALGMRFNLEKLVLAPLVDLWWREQLARLRNSDVQSFTQSCRRDLGPT